MKLTLDWNCVIEVEEGRPQAPAVKGLIDAHRKGLVEVALLAASASENTKSKVFPGNASLFMRRVSALGWDDLPLVPMPIIIGLSYINHAYIVGDAEDLKHKFDALWRVIAPRIARDAKSHLSSGRSLDDAAIQSEDLFKWRNTWCDVLSAYTHIHQRRDVFVTNNTHDFQAHRAALATLGMTAIATPAEAVALVAKA
jgi:hypothetical protein